MFSEELIVKYGQGSGYGLSWDIFFELGQTEKFTTRQALYVWINKEATLLKNCCSAKQYELRIQCMPIVLGR